jgi:hypothetical protein
MVACRPDFMNYLLSPVISMGQFAHPGSKRNLLGPTAQRNDREIFNRLQVSKLYSHPAFIVHSLNDSTVKKYKTVYCFIMH